MFERNIKSAPKLINLTKKIITRPYCDKDFLSFSLQTEFLIIRVYFKQPKDLHDSHIINQS